jgi:CBS domain-containing protein
MITVRQLLEGKGTAIFTVDPDDPVLEAVQLMSDHHVGALLVMRGEQLAGIVSERDYARKVVLRGRSSSETPVWQIMSAPVVAVTPEHTVQDCMRLMTDQRIRHLPVLRDDRVVGVVSIGDLVKAVIEEQARTIEQLESYIRG